MGKDNDKELSPANLHAATSRALSNDKNFQPSPHDYGDKSARFQADRDAFHHRFHDVDLCNEQQPSDGEQQRLFAALEEERFLSQGYRRFPGVAKHLPRGKSLPAELREIIGYLRHHWAHGKGRKPLVSDNLKPLLDVMLERRDNQKSFGEAIHELLASLVPPPVEVSEEENLEQPNDQQQSQEPTDASHSSKTPAPSQGQKRQRRQKLAEQEDPTSPATAQQQGESEPEVTEYDESYHPYTRRFDRVVRAESLCEVDERKRLKELFQEALEETDMRHTNRLMTQLRSVLQSQSLSKPQFDQEQGILHPPRLSRLVTSKAPLVYKTVEHRPFLETTVTLLIDNSGSMRGRPIRLAAISAYLLAETLNKCNVSVEVLGFTTALWNGGQTRNLWLQSGKPPSPGRLNDLLHIIYKDSDTSWRKGKSQFGVMLKEGLLKENIDGEALLWAYHRIQRRNEPRKILMVISDGAPVDDATLAANPGNYLDSHLHTTIKAIERNQDVELLAIGIGHDVGQYYPQSVTIDSADRLGETLFTEIIRLLS